MGRQFGVIIGVRRLYREESPRKVVTVTLGKPRRMMKGPDWECPFRISGLGIRGVQYGYGVDAIQAVTTALEGIRVTLERSGKRLSWVGGRDDTGFERLVTTSFGPKFTKQLNRVIDREIARFVRALKRRHHGRRPANGQEGRTKKSAG
jgi:hypothetical protein